MGISKDYKKQTIHKITDTIHDTYFAIFSIFLAQSHHCDIVWCPQNKTLTSASEQNFKGDSCQAQAAVSTPKEKKCSKTSREMPWPPSGGLYGLSNRYVEGKGCYIAIFASTRSRCKVQSRTKRKPLSYDTYETYDASLEVCDVLFLLMWSGRFPTWVYYRGCKDDLHHKA